MRHGIAGNRLGRNSSWRKATIRDLAKATLIQQRIKTTEAKAKEARKLVDELITLGKKGTLAHKRRAFTILCDHNLVSDLFNKTAVRFSSRNGGYTRIIKLAANRRGDNAAMVLLELTEKEKAPLKESKKPKRKPVSKNEEKTQMESAHEALPVKEGSEHKEEKKPKDEGGLKGIFRRKKKEK
ncbi:MAG: 50S ribosomal protein L17 [Candidatus Omnitrophota bacterium]